MQTFDDKSSFAEPIMTVEIINSDENENGIYEIILFLTIEKKLLNLNAYLVELNYAKCMDPRIFEKDKCEANEIIIPKKLPDLTNLDMEIKSFKRIFSNKIIKATKNEFQVFFVSNVISPSELWIRNKFYHAKNYSELQYSLNGYYSKLETNLKADWQIKEICVFKHPSSENFHRGKILEKEAGKKVKVKLNIKFFFSFNMKFV